MVTFFRPDTNEALPSFATGYLPTTYMSVKVIRAFYTHTCDSILRLFTDYRQWLYPVLEGWANRANAHCFTIDPDVRSDNIKLSFIGIRLRLGVHSPACTDPEVSTL